MGWRTKTSAPATASRMTPVRLPQGHLPDPVHPAVIMSTLKDVRPTSHAFGRNAPIALSRACNSPTSTARVFVPLSATSAAARPAA